VVENVEFRELLLYCARQLKDKDIPHRTVTTNAVRELFAKLMAQWIKEVQVRSFLPMSVPMLIHHRMHLGGSPLQRTCGPVL
jgi:hypothetical protein